jgi:hypothetical protein
MRSGRCPPHDGSRCEADLTCTTLLVDLEVHPPVIMRIRRHVDVSMTLEIYANAHADGDVRGAAQAGGPPSMRRSILAFVARADSLRTAEFLRLLRGLRRRGRALSDLRKPVVGLV